MKHFLKTKGASNEVIASIITRYPQTIVRCSESLEKHWELWRSSLKTDLEIINILERSLEYFFGFNNNVNMKNNIIFFYNIGLTSKDLYNMLTRAPQAFSNQVDLNQKMTDLLHEICLPSGIKSPNDLVREIISKNNVIFLRSSKQMRANIEFLQLTFKLDNEKLLALLHGQSVDILALCNGYMRRNFLNVKEAHLSWMD